MSNTMNCMPNLVKLVRAGSIDRAVTDISLEAKAEHWVLTCLDYSESELSDSSSSWSVIKVVDVGCSIFPPQ